MTAALFDVHKTLHNDAGSAHPEAGGHWHTLFVRPSRPRRWGTFWPRRKHEDIVTEGSKGLRRCGCENTIAAARDVAKNEHQKEQRAHDAFFPSIISHRFYLIAGSPEFTNLVLQRDHQHTQDHGCTARIHACRLGNLQFTTVSANPCASAQQVLRVFSLLSSSVLGEC